MPSNRLLADFSGLLASLECYLSKETTVLEEMASKDC